MRKIFTLFIAALCCASISAEIINGTSGDLTFNLNTEAGVMMAMAPWQIMRTRTKALGLVIYTK